MTSWPSIHTRAGGLALALAAVVALAPTPAADARGRCAGAGAHPDGASLAALESATLCLVNAERRVSGVHPLRFNAGLAAAGRRHARDMVRRQYFSHETSSGESFHDRIRDFPVARGVSALVGEDLAWGSRRKATPRSIVAAWMASPAHRANMLRPQFREAGVAIVRGAPRGAAHAATYAIEFGRRYARRRAVESARPPLDR